MKAVRSARPGAMLLCGGAVALTCLLVVFLRFSRLDGTVAAPSADSETLQHLARLEDEIQALELQQQKLAKALREAKLLTDAVAAANEKVEQEQNIPAWNNKPATPAEPVRPAEPAQPVQPNQPAQPVQPANKPPQANDDGFVLMVGGTDGSGTRSIVVLLQQLGVRMVVDDKGTQDVHAAVMGGWPPPVNAVLSQTHTLDYELSQLPSKLIADTERSISRLMKDLATKAKRSTGAAPGITYGFKAPVSMALTPFFDKMVPRFKFLHVVRDGRDIAFSGNQTPLKKYFDNYYTDKPGHDEGLLPTETQKKAIKMWSDWNVEAHEWETKHKSETFQYFVLRTEDLLDPATKFNTIRAVAEFVGSAASQDQLCCMAVAPAQFMGSHTKGVTASTAGSGASTVQSRYGKWHKHVQGQPELEASLNSWGAKGLELFGYEPPRDVSPPPDPNAHCTLSVQDCEAKFGKQPAPSTNAASKSSTKISARDPSSFACTFKPKVDYKGGSSDFYSTGVATAQECCDKCKAVQRCAHFTFDPRQRRCFLKTTTGHAVENQATTSGDVTSK